MGMAFGASISSSSKYLRTISSVMKLFNWEIHREGHGKYKGTYCFKIGKRDFALAEKFLLVFQYGLGQGPTLFIDPIVR